LTVCVVFDLLSNNIRPQYDTNNGTSTCNIVRMGTPPSFAMVGICCMSSAMSFSCVSGSFFLTPSWIILDRIFTTSGGSCAAEPTVPEVAGVAWPPLGPAAGVPAVLDDAPGVPAVSLMMLRTGSCQALLRQIRPVWQHAPDQTKLLLTAIFQLQRFNGRL